MHRLNVPGSLAPFTLQMVPHEYCVAHDYGRAMTDTSSYVT